MDHRTIELLAASFARVSANKDEAAAIFFARLFTVSPELRTSFRSELEVQKHELMSSVAQVVDFYRAGIDRYGCLARLGRKRNGYGADRAVFDAVGDALVFTLAQVLGEEFSADIRAAWVTCYAEVSAAILRSAEQENSGTHALIETQRLEVPA